MAEYRLSPAAERDLELIWLYSCEQWGLEQAHRYIDVLTLVFEALANAPQTAQSCDHIRVGYRRHPVERHVIYFRISAYGIVLIRILHARMDAIQHI